eukprot:GGOE01012870.1.p1 GENE.GGOE01012870.1~~GGOE01012870.1.p1  ORF type:complete len:118 (-),score=10.12 GGOE01012870.1:76-429(-)
MSTRGKGAFPTATEPPPSSTDHWYNASCAVQVLNPPAAFPLLYELSPSCKISLVLQQMRAGERVTKGSAHLRLALLYCTPDPAGVIAAGTPPLAFCDSQFAPPLPHCPIAPAPYASL